MALPVLSNEEIITTLDTGYLWRDQSGNVKSTITFSFPTAKEGMDNYSSGTYRDDFVAMTAEQQDTMRLALQMWDDLIPQSFQEISRNGTEAAGYSDIEFGSSTSYTGVANGAFPSTGSVWFNYDKFLPQNLTSYRFMAIMHEIGHTLGMDHSGTNQKDANGNYIASSYQDTTVLSIMSYFGPAGTSSPGRSTETMQADWTDANGNTYSPQTPMLDDILAIQNMYGVSTTTRLGDTVYGFHCTVTGASSKIYDFTLNTGPVLTLFDSGGIDTLDLSGWNSDATICLESGSYSSANNMSNSIAIAYSATIENAVGGGGNDVITGNEVANVLNGGAGADSMSGGTGNDTYYIDNAGDQITESSTLSSEIDSVISSLSYALGNNLEKLTLAGTAAINATGNALANTLTGNTAVNTINAGAGNDTLNGAAGADIMLGGAGSDVYIVDNAADKVYETTTTASTTDAGGFDTVQSSLSWTLGSFVENLTLTGTLAVNATGNALANTLIGNTAANTINAGAGNDTLNGAAGADIMLGGAGNDVYVVDNAADKVYETTTTTSATDAGGVDTVQSSLSWTLGNFVERLTLTGTLAVNGTGNALANTLIGNAATNTLNGGSGNDTLIAGAGNDVLYGGVGADRFVFDSKSGWDAIKDFASASDKMVFDNSALGGLGDKDAILEGGLLRSAAGGFAKTAELVVFSSNIAGSITTTTAAAKIGSATSAYTIGDQRLFVVDNGTQSNIYLFKAIDADAAVESNELQLLGTVNGQTALGDYLFQA
ncbi:M10 family metallopeptidase C-terminal domain-containing protein [Chitinibacter sp. S2-10]|uniref:M10 family metallopeptidase C-terminal domain-containing protein n=1 Tax=Chitinibacter sp. S2-10 TaxID=3373597 RepID=UPI0039776DE2